MEGQTTNGYSESSLVIIGAKITHSRLTMHYAPALVLSFIQGGQLNINGEDGMQWMAFADRDKSDIETI